MLRVVIAFMGASSWTAQCLASQICLAAIDKTVILDSLVEQDYTLINPGLICVAHNSANGLQARQAEIGRLTN